MWYPSYSKTLDNTGVILLIIGTLGFVHLINWLLTKGIIWFMFELFAINWYQKFWVVYIALFVVSFILKNIFERKN